MDDYKELIGDIDDCLIAHPSETLCKRILREAADAIERLVKERDAAVADIPTACGYCKWFRDRGEVGCFCQEPCRNIGGVNMMWEWRGVREVKHEAD